MKLWPWVPAASRHLPLLPLSLGMCERTVSPEEGTWNLEMSSGARPPSMVRFLNGPRANQPPRTSGFSSARCGEGIRKDPLGKLKHSKPGYLSPMAPWRAGPHVLCPWVASRSQCGDPGHRLPNSLLLSLVSHAEKDQAIFRPAGELLWNSCRLLWGGFRSDPDFQVLLSSRKAVTVATPTRPPGGGP